MNTHITCPVCKSAATLEEYGDTITQSCLACGWTQQSMVARDFPDMPRSTPIQLSIKTVGNVSAQALSAVRSLAQNLKEESPALIKARLASAEGIQLGSQAPYREQEIRSKLEPLGIKVLRHGPNFS